MLSFVSVASRKHEQKQSQMMLWCHAQPCHPPRLARVQTAPHLVLPPTFNRAESSRVHGRIASRPSLGAPVSDQFQFQFVYSQPIRIEAEKGQDPQLGRRPCLTEQKFLHCYFDHVSTSRTVAISNGIWYWVVLQAFPSAETAGVDHRPGWEAWLAWRCDRSTNVWSQLFLQWR